MKLTQLINKLISYNAKKDSIYLVQNIVNEIKSIESKDNIYIDNLLEVMEKREIEVFCLNMLTCALRDLPMSQTQIEKVWKMVNDTQHYNEGTREHLMKILASVPLEKCTHIIDNLYATYKNETSINKKIKIAELLINVKTLSDEIASWLFEFATNDSLQNSIDGVNTLTLKTDCCEILSENKKYLASAKKAIFHLVIECRFFDFFDDHQWTIIESCLLLIPLEREDIYYLLKLIKDKSLISYHRIHILSLLTKVPLKIDIVDNLIDMLIMEDESFEDFNVKVMNTILKLEITDKHIETIGKLQKSNKISRHVKMQLRKINV